MVTGNPPPRNFFRPLPPDLFLPSCLSDLLLGAGVETASPLALTCRRLPVQPVITLGITFSPSSSMPLPQTPIVHPVCSPRSLAEVLPFSQFHCSGSAYRCRKKNDKQSGRLFEPTALSLVRPGKHCNSTAVKARCRTCGIRTGLCGGGERPKSFDRLGEIVRATVLLFSCFPLHILRTFGRRGGTNHASNVASGCLAPICQRAFSERH